MSAIHYVTTTAADGDMRDSANRELLAKQIGIPAERFVWLNQVHGTRIAVVARVPDNLTVPETDGVVTNQPDVALAILTADCVPVVALDARAGVIGAAHAGRVGAQNGIVRELVSSMVGLGAQPDQIRMRLGPSAGGASYEVPEAMRDEVEALLPGSACVTGAGTPGLDLRAGIARQMEEAGVREVVTSGECTIKEIAYFSHRRDGKSAGRLATVIWMEQE